MPLLPRMALRRINFWIGTQQLAGSLQPSGHNIGAVLVLERLSHYDEESALEGMFRRRADEDWNVQSLPS